MPLDNTSLPVSCDYGFNESCDLYPLVSVGDWYRYPPPKSTEAQVPDSKTAWSDTYCRPSIWAGGNPQMEHTVSHSRLVEAADVKLVTTKGQRYIYGKKLASKLTHTVHSGFAPELTVIINDAILHEKRKQGLENGNNSPLLTGTT